jgi:anti-sigma B factor antagonist
VETPPPQTRREPIAVDRGRAGRAVVELRGEHDLYGSLSLRRKLDALLSEGLAVIVDLRAATFLDSATIGVLLLAHREAALRGQRFVLVLDGATEWPLRTILEVTGLIDVFAIAGTVEEALSSPRLAA